MAEGTVGFGTATLGNCDREEIQIPGSIQPHGAIVVLDPVSMRIEYLGGAVATLLGAAPDDLLGCEFLKTPVT